MPTIIFDCRGCRANLLPDASILPAKLLAIAFASSQLKDGGAQNLRILCATSSRSCSCALPDGLAILESWHPASVLTHVNIMRILRQILASVCTFSADANPEAAVWSTAAFGDLKVCSAVTPDEAACEDDAVCKAARRLSDIIDQIVLEYHYRLKFYCSKNSRANFDRLYRLCITAIQVFAKMFYLSVNHVTNGWSESRLLGQPS